MLADFVTELALKELEPSTSDVENESSSTEVLYTNGSTNRYEGGDRVILEGPKCVIVEHTLCFDFQTTNNQAEYEALIASLKLEKDMGVRFLEVKSDS